MSFFAELKRRNVFRVGLAYLIAAWVLLQVTDTVGEILELPAWGGKLILLVLAVGFPMALIFAWAFEMTPEGLKREKDVDRSQSVTQQTGRKLNTAILFLMALAIAYLLFDKFSRQPESPVSAGETAQTAQQAPAQTASEPPAAAARKSIAVLPFENRSNREEDQFFTDGIHDDLLTTIARISALRVISRTSVMEYKGTTKKIPQIAAELGVSHVMEGGIQRSGNQVRINVQLIDAQTDEHLWAEIYDRELTAENLFAIQSEISNSIAAALQTTLSPKEAERINRLPTDSLEAYDHYLRGRQQIATRKTIDLEAATREFQRAVELDPDFALAWVGVADSHALLANYTELDDDDFIELRRHAIDQALALDPGLGEAYASLGALYTDQYRSQNHFEFLDLAEVAFKKAIELNPNYATAYHWYGNSLILDVLRTRERLALAEKAIELDPRSLVIGANLVNEYNAAGLFSQAIQQAKKLIDIDPDFPNAHHELLDLYLWNTGDFNLALGQARKLTAIDPRNVDGWRHQVEIYAEIGDRDAAQAIQDKIDELNPDSLFGNYADLLFALRNGDAAAAREALTWTLKRPTVTAFDRARLSFFFLEAGDLDRALDLWLQAEPDWLQPEAWQRMIPSDNFGGCLMAWMLLHTGDTERGQPLLGKALQFQEQELPAAIEHPDRHGADVCYMAAGRHDQALDVLEQQLADGHFYSWARFVQSPVYDPIRLNPRFLELVERHDRLIERQAEAIATMDAETGT